MFGHIHLCMKELVMDKLGEDAWEKIIVDKKSNCEMILHYNSSRKGLYPWIKGMLGCIAREFFNTDIQLKVMDISIDNTPESRFQQHMVILIKSKINDQHDATPHLDKSISNAFRPIYPQKSLLSNKHMVTFLPYHIIFDSLLYVRQSGFMLQTLCGPLRDENNDAVLLSKIAKLVIPTISFDASSIRRFINSAFTFRLAASYKGLANDPGSGLLLRGQICYLDDYDCFFFIGSPRLMTLSELEEKHLFLSDIPLYDVTRELLLVNQQRLAEMEISKNLDEMTNQLQKTTTLLEEEKAKVNVLLSQMLPSKVAMQLLNGRKVEAEKFPMCTILFSDIVTFTNIASHCNPMDVVDMLNSLYSLFDKATEDNGAYKVETIGDAYMVVGGVPECNARHADIMAEQAMDMVNYSGQVRSPVTGKPLQIRVGIHSGPVVAGVVGEKMPRFCLFGDTVNVASRMESHGMPGQIHCSGITFQFLTKSGYIFEGRGEIEIKGKGLMNTYFLIGRGSLNSKGEKMLRTQCTLDTNDSPDMKRVVEGANTPDIILDSDRRKSKLISRVSFTKPHRSALCILL